MMLNLFEDDRLEDQHEETCTLSTDTLLTGTIMHPSKYQFDVYDVNEDLDVYTTIALLKVSPSVVSLVSYSGGEEAFSCSGVIFGSFWKDGSLYYSVLTSATLLKPPLSHFRDSRENYFTKDRLKTRVRDDNKKDLSLRQCRKNLKKRKRDFDLKQCSNKHVKPEDEECVSIDEEIDVGLRGGNLCVGTVAAYDPHYNIAVLTFKSDDRIPCAVLRPLDDSLAFKREPTNEQDSAHHVPYHPLKLIPGDAVIAVGRFMEKPFEIMAAPGKYSVDHFEENINLNCLELFMTDCRITKCGIGGPLISLSGEVIGINFYSSEHCTPFLPINIFLKWWSHHKLTGGHRRPSLGMKVADLHTADPGTLDQVQKLGISQGLIVEKVLSGSPAEICGLCPGDVVVKCLDTTIVSPLKLFQFIWGMAGKAIEIIVVREGSYKSMKIEVKDITSADEFYKWLLPREYMRRVSYPRVYEEGVED